MCLLYTVHIRSVQATTELSLVRSLYMLFHQWCFRTVQLGIASIVIVQ